MAALSDTRPAVIAIGGPTATGKTSLSVRLAKTFDGEIISADSMQIYKGLDIGTAKATLAEQQGIPHHLLSILSPEELFSVADFTALAGQQIQKITACNGLPLVVGGTGLYITSLLNGMRFTPEKGDPVLRRELQARAVAGEGSQLYEELKIVDPDYAMNVHPNNLPRVIRALELFRCTGRKMSEQRRAALPETPPYRSLCLCLTCHDRQTVYQRINERVDRMLAEGVLQEAEWVWNHCETCPTAAQAIGYKEFFPYFEGTAQLPDCVENLKQASRNYAKRQLTWFHHQNNAVWLYADDRDVYEQAEILVREFLVKPE